MPALSRELRRKLEETVKEAREVAEAGARVALEHLAVHEPKPYPHLSPEDGQLRNRLRAHARQLGDARDAKTGRHDIDHLVTETAYEHWHRMLFARFLAENGVLIHPDLEVSVTLEECEEFAPEYGAGDGWELAARFAARMLPQVFRPDDPVLQVKLPTEKQRALEKLVSELSVDTFLASDSIGWVYQFWQSKQKDEINQSGAKIGRDELPPVTQLFTEPYMVDFLLQNTLGAWWVGRYGKQRLPQEMPYLRLLGDETPAAGTFDKWPTTAASFRVLDPCCGSGHFLVAAFRMLVKFRMAEDGLDARAAGDAVLRENLFGLEIDPRCTQIAAFALALAAWTYPDTEGWRPLTVQVACSGLPISERKERWLGLAESDFRLRNGMDELYELFRDAPVLGSLIDPTQVQGTLLVAGFDELRPLLDRAVQNARAVAELDRVELGLTAQGIVHAAHILAQKFDLIVTNVPYLARSKQDEALQDFCAQHYGDAKSDLATVFLDRLLGLVHTCGTVALVLPQNSLFLKSYMDLRIRLLKSREWHFVIGLGPKAFETPMWDFNVALLALSSSRPASDHSFMGIDASEPRTAEAKSQWLREACVQSLVQHGQLRNPDARVIFDQIDEGPLLERVADSYQGLKSGDDGRYRRYFWEVDAIGSRWKFLQSTVSSTRPTGGLESVVDWTADGAHLARRQGLGAWGRVGVAVSQMNALPCALYFGDAFDSNVSPIVPKDPAHTLGLWAYCESGEYQTAVRKIDRKLAVANATLVKVPFDFDYWAEVAKKKYPNGLPLPYSNDPTQWVFHGHPASSDAPLHVAVARLLGYKWPAEMGSSLTLSAETRRLIQLAEQLSPYVDTDGIVCIPPVRGDESAAERVLALLTAAYGGAWSSGVLEELLDQVGYAGKGLDRWLREKFFEQHCALFGQRPFIWHIWDGSREGFAALVNSHKLDRRLLETLTYNYLNDWIKRQEDSVKGGAQGAEERLQAARVLQEKLRLILRGETPLDIFVRWKSLEQQPIGWNPDLNDGIRVNIRPFVKAEVLRKNPKIDWNKDRGQDPVDSPWFHVFDGERVNNHSLSLAEKDPAARYSGGAE